LARADAAMLNARVWWKMQQPPVHGMSERSDTNSSTHG